MSHVHSAPRTHHPLRGDGDAEGVRAQVPCPGTVSGGMGIAHIRHFARRIACAAVVVASLTAASTAAAAMPSSCQDAFFTGGDVCRAEPISPAGALDHLGSTGSPEDDLMQAIKDLGAAPTDAAAAKAR